MIPVPGKLLETTLCTIPGTSLKTVGLVSQMLWWKSALMSFKLFRRNKTVKGVPHMQLRKLLCIGLNGFLRPLDVAVIIILRY